MGDAGRWKKRRWRVGGRVGVSCWPGVPIWQQDGLELAHGDLLDIAVVEVDLEAGVVALKSSDAEVLHDSIEEADNTGELTLDEPALHLGRVAVASHGGAVGSDENGDGGVERDGELVEDAGGTLPGAPRDSQKRRVQA